MNEVIEILSAGMAGVGLGVLFFGGLWWTVNRCASSRRPGLLVFVSLVVRLSVILAGFHVVAGSQWQGLLACLAGFVVARFLVTRILPSLLGRFATRRSPPSPEATHAP